MNSTERKRALLADPTHLQPEQVRALEQDTELRAWFNEALELDGLIHQAMQLPVPEDLEERLQSLTCGQPVPRRTGSRRWLQAGALAASLALVVAGYSYLGFRDPAAEIIAHIQHEPASLISDNGVKLQDVQALLADYGMRLQTQLGKVTYLTRCRLQGHAGVHMVLETDYGRVTVLLVPGLAVKEMKEIQGDGLEGYLIALQERYGMAIVGRAGQPLMQVERLLRDAIRIEA